MDDWQHVLWLEWGLCDDPDYARQTPYNKIRCAIDSACGLSANTVRILESIFGQIT